MALQEQPHPAVHHLLRAAKHLHAAADGYAGEAEAHVREARRLEDRAESER